MEITPALLEYWLRDYYFSVEHDIGCSGVQNYSLRELRELLGFTLEELDAVVFNDSWTLGEPELRRTIARRWAEGRAERVMVTHGSSEAMYLVVHALLRAGDEVVVLDPAYQPLQSIAASVGCRLRHWRLRFDRGFAPDIEEAKRLIGPRTRMVIVNFPHNPTGATLSREELRELVAACERVGAYLLWDAAFAEVTYDAPPLPDPALGYERAVSLYTLSKAFGLPGLRVGWCVAAPEVLERCVRLRDYITLHLSPLVELVARKVVEQPERLVAPRVRQAKENLDALAGWVEGHEGLVEWARPRGGVSTFLRLPRVGDVEAFCHRLAREHRTLAVPGVCFGHPSHVRVGFGGAAAGLSEGLGHFSHLLRRQHAAAH